MQYLGIHLREMRKFTHSLNKRCHLQGLRCVESGKGTNVHQNINLISYANKIKKFDYLHRAKSNLIPKGFKYVNSNIVYKAFYIT
jgi:hypothetical protein